MGLFKAISDAVPLIGQTISDAGGTVRNFAVDRAKAAKDALDAGVNYVKENPGKTALGVGGVAGLGGLTAMGGMMAGDAVGDQARENFNPYSAYDDDIQGMKDSTQQLGEIANNQREMNDINFGLFDRTSRLQRELGRDTIDQKTYAQLAQDKQKLKADEAMNVLNNATQANQTAGQILAAAAANNWT